MALSVFPRLRSPLVAGVVYGAVTIAVSSVAQVHASLFASRLAVGGFSDGGAAGFSDASPGAWAARLFSGLHAAIGIEECLIPAPLALGVLFILLHSLRKRDFRVLYLCLWAGGTIVLSLALKGYWQRVPEFDIQRAMIVLPPLSLALAMYVAANTGAIVARNLETALRGMMISGMLFMLLNSAYLPLIRRVPRAYVPFEVTDREEAAMLVIERTPPDPRTVYLVPPLYFPLEQTLAYFSPGTQVVRSYPPAGEHRPGAYVISYIGKEPYVREDPDAQLADHPVRYAHPRPYLRISPE
jgi:hypothetical protein